MRETNRFIILGGVLRFFHIMRNEVFLTINFITHPFYIRVLPIINTNKNYT